MAGCQHPNRSLSHRNINPLRSRQVDLGSAERALKVWWQRGETGLDYVDASRRPLYLLGTQEAML